MHLHISEVDPLGADALALLRQAAIEARALYPELHEPDSPLPVNEQTPFGGVYLVAFLDQVPVGMGALRPLDSRVTEVRRMYTAANSRRVGVARAILGELEDHARRHGFQELRLETGYRQLPAIALYESLGFKRIPPFGPYRNDPTSVCYAKSLVRSEA